MPTPSLGIRFALATIAASLALSSTASAQQPFPPPAKPIAAPSPRGASCHNGMSFDRFLTELKQQATAAGVSQQALAEASPYLVYDQGIVNGDHGQRVFGQAVLEFPGRR